MSGYLSDVMSSKHIFQQLWHQLAHYEYLKKNRMDERNIKTQVFFLWSKISFAQSTINHDLDEAIHLSTAFMNLNVEL